MIHTQRMSAFQHRGEWMREGGYREGEGGGGDESMGGNPLSPHVCVCVLSGGGGWE
jgi:hypothetical protein